MSVNTQDELVMWLKSLMVDAWKLINAFLILFFIYVINLSIILSLCAVSKLYLGLLCADNIYCMSVCHSSVALPEVYSIFSLSLN